MLTECEQNWCEEKWRLNGRGHYNKRNSLLRKSALLVKALGRWLEDWGFKPQHCQAAAVGPLNKAPNPPCSRGAASWLTLRSDPNAKDNTTCIFVRNLRLHNNSTPFEDAL
ncbi:hypothetical protein KOW79_019952 [Hemibagrus wyckioides]|uniref:Uncharacterized protein n=1 Tax=Hemibagrus wyckioides TaxID=337641 RepID=A0A9D3N5E5_9TELE|nr:hypothetical protein KOW79_019952 [Hemibagrus wyckioides]